MSLGNLTAQDWTFPNTDIPDRPAQTVGWTRTLNKAAKDAFKGLPIFLGGDHSLTRSAL
jgi:arginase